MSWTTRMIETLTAKGEELWGRFCGAQSAGSRKHWQREYNRVGFALAYLRGRLQG